MNAPYPEKSATAWQRIGWKDHSGIAVPLFTLKSSTSLGIGEFTDLCPLIPWCKEVGFDVIQLLPLNDTGLDTSPYNALSAFALNPIYLGLKHLPHYQETDDTRALEELNREKRVDYLSVAFHKWGYLRDYFVRVGKTVTQTAEFQQFVKNNPWLTGYALFKVLKLGNDWHPWRSWDSSIQNPSPSALHRIETEFSENILFQKFVQFLSFEQLKAVKKSANEQGVFLKGDIPILISPDSADVWLHQELFDLSLVAGAPPDMYNHEGQKWGFPLYRWDKLKETNYHWWKERLRVASELYDIYRIDHIVGFFRIYAIPTEESAKSGFYIPEKAPEWQKLGEDNMVMLLSATGMLPIGEDLGVVPDEVRTILRDVGIAGTKVMRWERRWKTDESFIPVSEYPQLSMTTVSTHDSDTLTQWWRDSKGEAELFAKMKGWNYNPVLSEAERLEILRDSYTSGSLFHINLLGEILALSPDLRLENPDDERINIPGKQLPRNWTIRMRPTVEEIARHEELKEILRQILPTYSAKA